MKLPPRLLSWLEREARRVNQPKSELVRQILEQYQQQQQRSALDLAADFGRCKRFKVEARPMGLRADIDPARLNQLADELEVDASLLGPNAPKGDHP